MKSKLVLVADAHIKFKEKTKELEYSMSVLQEALTYACKHQADIMLLGDVIDQCTNRPNTLPVPLPVLLSITKWLKSCRTMGVNVYWIRGNHITKDHSRPEESILEVFSHLARTVNKPAAYEHDDYYVIMVPWYPRPVMEDIFLKLSNQLRGIKKPKYLFSHLALKEGVLENDRNSPNAMSVERLYPDMYHRVLLGDYHRRQTVGYPHVQYMGIPTPRKYNDYEYFSIHLLDLSANRLDELPLNNFYPSYKTYKITDPKQASIASYDPRNYNRIIVPADMEGKFNLLYPDASIEGLGVIAGEVSEGRLEGIDVLDSVSTWKNFCQEKELGVKYENAGERYLTNAK